MLIVFLVADARSTERPSRTDVPAETIVGSETRARRTVDVTWNEQNGCAMGRVMRHGVRHQRNFSRTAFGSRDAAEKAAAAWVRQTIKDLPPEIPRKGRMTASNRSGVVGVWLVPVRITKPDGWRYEYWRWTANWPRCPHSGGVSWYVHQYGDEAAFVLAVLTRRMETVDRAAVLERFEAIDGTAEFAKIAALRADGVEAPEEMDDEADE
jgi:hypothetical protein